MKLRTLKHSFRRALAVLTIASAGVASAAGYDLEFTNGVAEPGGGACALTLNSRCRFSNVVIGAGTGSANPFQRDVVVTVTKLISVNATGATTGTTTLGVFDNPAPGLTTPPVPVATPTQFFSPSVQPQQTTANITGWAEFTFDLVTPGGAAPAVGAGTANLPGNVWVSSFDTDSDGGTLREFVEFVGVSATDTALSAATTLTTSTAVDGGVQYQSGAGSVAGISTDPNYKASAVYTNPASFKLVYGAQTGTSGSTAGPRLTAFDFLRSDAVLLRPLVDGYKSVKLTDADGNGAATPGDTLTYTVTYVNTGNAAVTGFQITDALPAGVTAAAGAQTVRVNGTVTASAKNTAYTGAGANTTLLAAGVTLPVNGTVSVDILVTVGAVATDNTTLSNQTTSGGSYVNAAGATITQPGTSSDNVDNTMAFPPAVVTATGFGTVPAGSVAQTQVATTDPTTVNLRRLPQLTLSKTIAAPGRVNAADQFTVQIKTGATVTASASTTGTGTAVSTAATTLASGTAYTLTEVMAAGSVSAFTSYNTAAVCTNSTAGSATVLPSGAGQSFTLTPALGDAISCTLTNTARQADLAINKTGPSVVTKNGTATYTLTVWNRGPDSVTGATIADSVPANLTGVSFTCTASGAAVCGTASGSGNAISFASGLLPVNNTATTPVAGDYLTIKVAGTASTAGTITNTATVTSPTSSLDGVAANNTSSQTTLINNPPVTADVTNALLLDTAAATVLNPNLSATDPDGNATITTYTIVTIPSAVSGVLSVNGATITAANTSFTAAQLATLSFAPKAGFAGNAAFTYTATDNQGAVSNTSTCTIPVNVAPVAVSDTSSTPANASKTFSVTNNDTDTAPGTINIASTVFATSGQPAGEILTNGNRTITVPGEGSYVLDNAGNVLFTPVSGYSGTTAAVKYTVTDNQGAVSNVASITVTVTPVAVNDTANTTPSTLVNIPVLTNDVGTGKVLTSLLFPATGQPAGSVVTGGGKTLTNADGVYTIKPGGTVDFTPALGKTGTLSPVLYTFVDGAGQISNPATITITVGSITPPTATNDSKTTPKNTAVTLEGSTNDTAGSLPIDNASVILTAGGTITNVGKTLTNAQGVYQVQANGTVIFTPASTFAGVTTPVSYTVKDTSGAASNAATLSVTVTNQPPVANNVTNALLTSTAPATTLNPGVSGSDPDGTVVTYTVTALPSAAQGALYCGSTAIATAPSNCAPAQLSFQPNPAFNGNATFQYTVTDDNGAVSNVAIYTIPVNKPPVAVNDSAATNPNVNVTFSVTGNDTDTAPGTVNVTTIIFDPSSTGTISNAGKTLTVPGEGVYTANADGTVTFAPQAGFNNGISTAAKYTVKDNNGAFSNVATITVAVPASVDLGLTKTGPAYFKPSDTLSYTLTVTNSGSAASGVTVTDTLPTGLTFATASSGGTYNAGTGKVSWTLGNVASGANVVLTLTGTAPLAASVETNSGPTSLTNAASTAANEAEVVTTNNSASTVSQLVYPKLIKRVRNVTTSGAFGTTGTGKPAEVLEYCIDFRNYGVAVASFVISDSVPTNTNADLSGYGAGLGLQVTRGGVTTRTSTGGDTDGGSLSAAAMSLDLGSLAAGESGSVCFQASIK